LRTILVLLVLFLAGCQELPTEAYAFEPGRFDPDKVPGIERLDAAASEGDIDAQFQVALFRHYMTGEHKKAIRIFERLANAGHLESAVTLAGAYRNGRDVAVDYDHAAYWLERARELGSESAARDLAAYQAFQSHQEL